MKWVDKTPTVWKIEKTMNAGKLFFFFFLVTEWDMIFFILSISRYAGCFCRKTYSHFQGLGAEIFYFIFFYFFLKISPNQRKDTVKFWCERVYFFLGKGGGEWCLKIYREGKLVIYLMDGIQRIFLRKTVSSAHNIFVCKGFLDEKM